MRLIDADALKEQVCLDGDCTQCKTGINEKLCKWNMVRLNDVMKCIGYAPTIDAVPINRCKTCTFWDTEANEPDDLHNGLCTLNKIGTSDYFYCGAWANDTHEFFNGERDDWVPVVRCKDCKWWHDNGTLTGFCERLGTLGWFGTDYSDYCSFAERKDDEC